MDIEEILEQLEKGGLAIIASTDSDGRPHARPIHIGVADHTGIYFMTSPETDFYEQITEHPYVAITSYHEQDYLIEVIRIEGLVRPVDKQLLSRLLENNPYVNQVYPDSEKRSYMQVFQCYKGDGFYHSLTQGHRYTFSFDTENDI